MRDRYKYLIVGAGQAGHSCAVAIRKVDSDGSLALVGAEKLRPYNRPPLSKGILTGQMEPRMAFVQPENFYPDNGIDLITGAQATALNLENRTVDIADGRILGYERLLLATGGRPRTLDLPGSDLDGIFTLRNMSDSLAIGQAARQAGRAIVIGGGFIGAEAAASLSSIGIRITMIFRGERVLHRVLPEDFGLVLHRLYEERGVEIVSGDMPEVFEGDGRLQRVRTRAGRVIESDLAVLGVGIELNTGFAGAAGLEMAGEGAIATDERMRTSARGVWAAGDVAAYRDINFGRRLRIEHYYSAQRQGLAAGTDMAGGEGIYNDLPYFFSGFFDKSIQIYGRFNPEDIIRRGEPDTGSVAYFSFGNGVLEGYFHVGRPEAEQEAAKRLIMARRRKGEIAAALADESKNLV